MQLKDNKSHNIARLVTLATCSLLAAAPMATEAQDASDDGKRPDNKTARKWTTQAAVLNYSEDGRIEVNQGSLKVKGEHDKGSLQINLGYDIVSGPSENGAVPTPQAQTFTSPSGNVDYQIEPGELPWYEIERHPRKEISISKTDILNSDYTISYGARYSTEATYISRSANGGVTRNANNKNTQYSLAFAYENADVRPYGGAVTPRSTVINRSDFAGEEEFIAAWEAQRTEKSKDKDVYDVVAGVTQVVNRKTLMQFNYSYGESHGYQNDAQKIVSVIDEDGLVLRHVHENRPDERVKQSLFWKGKFSLSKKTVLDLNYRYYWDDWSISSHTLSAGYQIELGDRFKIEPQVRWYDQSSAKFFRHSVFAETDGSATLPAYLSADYRLAATTNYTLGVNLDYYRANGDVLSMRVAFYDINPKQDDAYTRGYLETVDVVPSIRSTMLAFSYEF